MKKKITVFSIAAIGIIAAGVMTVLGMVGVSKVAAQVSNGNYPLIIQNLASKFGLNPDDVNQVFEDTRDQRFSERLDNYVEDGVITEDQKQMILDKQDEIQTKIEDIDNQSLTLEERRTAMQEIQDEVRTWADENDIPLYLVMGFGMKGRGLGFGGMGFHEGMHMYEYGL